MAKRLRKASRIYDLDELEDEIEEKFEVEEEKRILQQRMLQRGLSINVVDINVIFLQFIFNDLYSFVIFKINYRSSVMLVRLHWKTPLSSRMI